MKIMNENAIKIKSKNKSKMKNKDKINQVNMVKGAEGPLHARRGIK